jgi:hypothetical protein
LIEYSACCGLLFLRIGPAGKHRFLICGLEPMMNKLFEPAVNVYQAQLQATKDLGEVLLSGVGQLDRLALQAAKDALDEQRKSALSLAAASDFDAATAALRETLTPPDFERATALLGDMQKTLSNTLAGMFAVCKSYMQEFDRNTVDVISAVQQETKSVAGFGASGNATDFWKAAWQQAWQQMNAISEQYSRAVQSAAADDKAAVVQPAKITPAPDTRSRTRTI